MKNDWSLRNEILITTHRWPVILAYCLMGALLGWAASLAWPSPYRLSTDLYVALNIEGWTKDHNAPTQAGYYAFNYPDDYKNWQMANLNTLIFGESVISETLTRLQQQDGYWNEMSRDELVEGLHVYWRNVGRWRLVAENKDPKYGKQAVEIWRDVILETVKNAVERSQQALVIDEKLTAIRLAQTEIITHTAQIREGQNALQNWSKAAQDRPAETRLGEIERQNVLSALRAAEPGPAAVIYLDAFPTAEEPIGVYILWAKEGANALAQEASSLYEQNQALETERVKLSEEYFQAIQGSYGFSASLQVLKMSDAPLQQSVARPSSTLALIGAFLGFLAWAIAWFLRIEKVAKA